MTRPCVVVDENIPGAAAALAAVATVVSRPGRAIVKQDLQGAAALLVRSVTTVNAELVSTGSLQFVGSATSGIEHIDRDYLARSGIAFAAAPGSNANAVVEYVLAAIAASPGRLEQLLAGDTVGVVGQGHVGRLLCQRLTGLGISVRAYDPWLKAVLPWPRVGRLDEVLDCSVISLHTDLHRRPPHPSFHLFGDTQLAALADNALLINASRGSVVDNRALTNRLLQRPALEVVLDVWEGEPQLSLELMRQVRLATPHIAGHSMDAKWQATAQLLNAMAGALQLSIPDVMTHLAPAPSMPVPEEEGVDWLRALLQLRYRIVDDDSAMRRQLLNATAAELPQRFDRLRKEYAPRRELAGSVLCSNTGALEPQQQQWLDALDCSLTATPGNP